MESVGVGAGMDFAHPGADARSGFDLPMTAAEQSLADDRMRAEIAKLVAETAKINAEARWYPFIATAGLFGAAIAVVKIFLT